MNDQQEREQFENQFAYPRGWRNFTRSEEGFYVVHDGALEAMWKAWKAGRAALAAQGVPEAMATVIAAMKADPDYAWSWHCNVAMGFVDAGGDRHTANQGAARFMRLLAGVEPAHELPAPAQAQQAASLAPKLQALLDTPWTLELAYQEGFGDAPNFKSYEEAWALSVTRDKQATPPQAQQAAEPTCFGAGDAVRLRAAALAVFDGPECPQIARDVIEWYHGSLLVEVCDDPNPVPAQAQAQQAEPLTDEQVINALETAGLNLAFRSFEQDIECARAIEAACAEKWGVKLAGIGASSGGNGNG